MAYQVYYWPTELPRFGCIEVYCGGDYHRFYADWIKDLESADLALRALGFTRTSQWDTINRCEAEPIPLEEWKVWRASQPEELRV